jgi:hypothetical protein
MIEAIIAAVAALLVGFQLGVKKEGGRWVWQIFRSPIAPESE